MRNVLRVLTCCWLYWSTVGIGHAALIVKLTPTSLVADPSDVVEFTGVITNNGTDDVFLNGALSDLAYPELALDSSPFFDNAPLFLGGGDFFSGPLFDVMVSMLAVPNVYAGTFTIQGGETPDAVASLATADFQIIVSESPEPGTGWIMAISTLPPLLIFFLRRIKD